MSDLCFLVPASFFKHHLFHGLVPSSCGRTLSALVGPPNWVTIVTNFHACYYNNKSANLDDFILNLEAIREPWKRRKEFVKDLNILQDQRRSSGHLIAGASLSSISGHSVAQCVSPSSMSGAPIPSITGKRRKREVSFADSVVVCEFHPNSQSSLSRSSPAPPPGPSPSVPLSRPVSPSVSSSSSTPLLCAPMDDDYYDSLMQRGRPSVRSHVALGDANEVFLRPFEDHVGSNLLRVGRRDHCYDAQGNCSSTSVPMAEAVAGRIRDDRRNALLSLITEAGWKVTNTFQHEEDEPFRGSRRTWFSEKRHLGRVVREVSRQMDSIFTPKSWDSSSGPIDRLTRSDHYPVRAIVKDWRPQPTLTRSLPSPPPAGGQNRIWTWLDGRML